MNLLLLVALTFFSLHMTVARNSTEDIEIVEAINAMNTTWSACINEEIRDIFEKNRKYAKTYSDLVKASKLPGMRFIQRISIPRSFDAREKWPKCKAVIERIGNQGFCSSCWAVQTAAMLSDRTCIGSSGSKQHSISAEDLMSCCNCGSNFKNSCEGGDPDKALNYWKETGIVSGGMYGTNEGCKPYSQTAYRGKHIPCKKDCTNQQYDKIYSEDKNTGKLVYQVTSGELQIQQEIMRYGPVVAFMMAYDDLRFYHDGIYKYTQGKYNGPHLARIIGWGVDNGVKYWLCVNSWGSNWGNLGGYFKILRGENHVRIESIARAGRITRKSSPREVLVGGMSKGNLCTKCVILIFILLDTVLLFY